MEIPSEQELQVQPGIDFVSIRDQGNSVDTMTMGSMSTGGVSSNLQQFGGLSQLPPQSDDALQDISAAMGMFSPQLSLQSFSQANPNSMALQRQQQQQLMLQQHQQLALQQQQQQFAFQQQQQMALNGLHNSQMGMQMPTGIRQMVPQSNGLATFPGNQLGLTELSYQQLMMNPNMQQGLNLAQFRGAPGVVNLQSLQASGSGGLKTQQLSQMSLPGDAPRPSAPGTGIGIPPSMLPADNEVQLAASTLDQYGAKGTKEPPFPLKLHQILSNPDYQECICWLPHGRSWRILKPSSFEQVVIPLYFRHAKYASFMRQVNGWGFKRMVQGMDHNSYYHELFLRDLPELSLKMRRAGATKSAGGEASQDGSKSKKSKG